MLHGITLYNPVYGTEMTVTLPTDLEVARAFVPGHITGFFAIRDDHYDPLYRGSIGAGFSVKAGTTTEVRVKPLDELEIVIEYNGIPIDATVTRTVVQRLAGQFDTSFSVQVSHDSDLPIGVGYGASGAGALGAALAFADILGLDRDTAAKTAHYAEVINHAGLGDVLAQYHGGIEIRTRPGAPGIGLVEDITSSEPFTVLLAGTTGIETKDVLNNPTSRGQINQYGEELIISLLKDPSLEGIVQHSRCFAESTGLMTDRVRGALDDLDLSNLSNSSMVMLGDSVFCLCQQDEVEMAQRTLQKYWSTSEILKTSIETEGGRLVS